MAAHRYWGVFVRPRSGDSTVGLAELGMRSSVGGSSIATGGTPGSSTSDGTASGGNGPKDKAFDGLTTTAWYSGAGAGSRLSYDFGTPVTIVELAVTTPGGSIPTPAGTSTSNVQLSTLVVMWSDDGSNFYFGSPSVDMTAVAAGDTTIVGDVTDAVGSPQVHGDPIRTPDAWPTSTLVARAPSVAARYDPYDGGPYRVAGNVAIDGTPVTPVARRVRLFHRLTGRLVRETWSNAAGDFEFAKIAAGEYIVLTDDYTRLYNAVVADAVQAVL